MSVIRKYPFIDDVINKLSLVQKQALVDVMNSAGNNVEASLLNMPAKGITPVLFKLDGSNLKTGILIYVDDVPVTLIAYHRFQDVLLFRLYPDENKYEKINEYCDINELRRLLTVGEDVSAGEIDSGNSTENQVLASDGSHGAHWVDGAETVKMADTEEGVATKMAAFDAEGNLIYTDIPSGTLVADPTLDKTSHNAIENAPVAIAIDALEDDVDALEADMETKANVDGNYPTMTVGVADQLSPYDDESGDDQDEPFSFQATGTGNGSQPDFATGAIALMKEKRGNSVVVNQLVTIADWTGTYSGITVDLSASGSATINAGTSTSSNSTCEINKINIVKGHKYLLRGCFAQRYSNADLWLANINTTVYTTWNTAVIVNTNDWNNDDKISTQIFIEANVTYVTTTYKPMVVDLTQWFGSNDNIPAHLLSHPENFFRYYQGSLAYNTGELVNANSRYLKAIGRNLFDEEMELGTLGSSGENVSSSTQLRSKNYIRVIPGETNYFYCGSLSSSLIYIACFYDCNKTFITSEGGYYNNTFNVPSNACYMRFYLVDNYGTTYNHDITISIYYEDESGYDQYYPYEVLTNNDTGTETLRSAGSVSDSKAPDGTITRRVDYVDLGSLTWVKTAQNNFMAPLLDGANSGNNLGIPALCSKYVQSANGAAFDAHTENSMLVGSGWVSTDSYVVIYDSNYESSDATAFKTAMSGVYLFYELAEPTTEQGTPYSENIVIDDFGSMDFSGTSGVPQGNLIFYPVDYKAFIDTLYNYTEGTPSNIALKSDLTTVDNKIGAKLPECPTTTNGTYVLKATVNDGAVVYNWVLEE